MNEAGDYNRGNARIFLLGAWVNPLSQQEAIDRILSWCATRAARYAVTPNLDLCRMLRFDPGLASAYDKAGLVLADGWPLVAASYVTPFPLKHRVTGSDIILPLCRACAKKGYSVFLLGTTDEVLAIASARLREEVPGLIIAGTHSPPMGFERDANELAKIDAAISNARPHLVFAAFGSPKQELWMQAHVASLPVGAAMGIGAGLDFIAGRQHRAPAIFRLLAMEWLWRAITDPKRLLKRYALCLLALPGLTCRHLARHLIHKTGVRNG